MVKYKSFHTHLNASKGEEEPLFLVVEGRFCENCKKEKRVPSRIFDVLQKAAKLEKQTIDQSDKEYIGSLLSSVMELPEEKWNQLPIDAQEWFNNAVLERSSNPKDWIPNCPGFVGLEQVEEVKASAPPKRGLSASEIFSGAQPPKPIPVSKPGKKPTTGITDFTRRLIISHPEWPVRQIFDYLKLNGFPNAKIDSISVARGDIRRVMEIMKEIGWKEPNAKTEPTETKEAATA